MKNNIPFFELNGQKFEIRRTRYLQAEFDKLKDEVEMTDEESVAYAKETNFEKNLEKLAERKESLYEKYLETFDEEDEKMYEKACKAYDKLIEEYGKGESVVGKQRKKLIDIGEKIIIKSLEFDREGQVIRTNEQANEIWCSFVDEVGQYNAMQFIAYTMNYIVGTDEELDNPFMTQAKAKAEQKLNAKKGLKLIK